MRLNALKTSTTSLRKVRNGIAKANICSMGVSLGSPRIKLMEGDKMNKDNPANILRGNVSSKAEKMVPLTLESSFLPIYFETKRVIPKGIPILLSNIVVINIENARENKP